MNTLLRMITSINTRSVFSVFCCISFSIFVVLTACKPKRDDSTKRLPNAAPVLVVGIVVDQMRADYIHRYWDKLGEGGFKRLVMEGFTFTNAHYGYYKTFTGPGHASIYTGTTPSIHGVLSNNVSAPGYKGVGTHPDYEGSIGPRRILSTTVGDELRLHTNNRSQVVSISLKDRGAVLPGGYTGDAYWHESKTGNFVTSTYYKDELPNWVKSFNDRRLQKEYRSKPWETLLQLAEYVESIPDDNPYEKKSVDDDRSAFPHEMLGPFGDKLLTEFAISAIEGESLGSGPTTDLLAISYSSPDGVGHAFGPASIEVQDTYLRLDQNITKLLDYLDVAFGKENILLFLTADHGAVHNIQYLIDQKIRGGYYDRSSHENALRAHLEKKYGQDFVSRHGNYEVFLNHKTIDKEKLNLREVQDEVARFLITLDGIAGTLTAETLTHHQFTQGVEEKIQKAFYPKRSGDVMFWFEPQWFAQKDFGTGHGSPWNYDTHIPMHWYGWNIPAGESSKPVYVSDIAPTVATFLNSPFPSGTTGNPLNDYMR